MMTEVTDCAVGALRIGMRLRVHFRPTSETAAGDGDGPAVPVFRPVA
jgi:hypothetical protein